MPSPPTLATTSLDASGNGAVPARLNCLPEQRDICFYIFPNVKYTEFLERDGLFSHSYNKRLLIRVNISLK